ncbi:TIGR01777 family oxidoreductase [Rubellicoccus peritrichatus]|uniref:TIGR01777 family oxidoreductase n=1 Tax=Rubellicoccus peritrichatus TaxID=3080537 RepID=A0AAQ3QVT9_9BACT|nr:TIGR01777 family oxidoreductase [Puniceicoccus sp. CR14]WOO41250.1 TIGR01777 family oxidoreductase [Puniceicoccus sp. CR14]
MKIAITGASGLVGQALSESLKKDGHMVLPISRSSGDDIVCWNPEAGTIEKEKLHGCDAIVNLAGEGIAQRWTSEVKRRILDSRIKSTRLIAETAASLEPKPKALINASAIGIYGYKKREAVDEDSSYGTGFLADVCKEWEPQTNAAEDAGIRVAQIRIGIVLSPKGGALAKMITPFKAGVGGPVGNGKQIASWIALDDLVHVFRLAIENDSVSGVINAVAPNPVSNREFATVLGQVLGRPSLVPAPAIAVKLAFGEMAAETVLSDLEVKSRRLPELGFEFQYPTLPEALKYLLVCG